MKTAFVTSEVTYIPRNYLDLFREVAERCPEQLGGLIILEADRGSLLKSALGLIAFGAPRIGIQLLRNLARSGKRERESLFQGLSLPVLRAKNMNEKTVIEWLKKNEIDLVVNARTRCIYREEILNTPRLGCVNIHHGILPEDRGAMCDLYALSEDRSAGFSVHEMNEKLDDGAILHCQKVSKNGEKNYVSYLGRTGKQEGIAIANLILEHANHGAWVSKTLNHSDKITFRKTPRTRAEIGALNRKGMKL